MEPQKYRKKPVVIEAWQASYDNRFEVAEWCGGTAQVSTPSGTIYAPGVICIETLEGPLWASVGDFVIKGVKGEFYACKPDIFEMTYERIPSLDQNEDGSTICKVCGYDMGPFRYCPNDHRPYESSEKAGEA